LLSAGSIFAARTPTRPVFTSPRRQTNVYVVLSAHAENLMTALENLKRLGLALPAARPGVGNYEPWVRTGSLVMTSGQSAWLDGVLQYPGRLGAEVSDEEGYQSARLAALNGIAQLQAATGDLEKVRQVVRVEGLVHCAPGYRGHPEVLNGASDLLREVFGDRGRHTRTSLGISDMALNASVMLMFWAEVAD
jgi:enamine deaminase RidA (YjgF/YER057c/UK114 family)